MTIEEAIKVMKEGKKVRREDWKPNSYIWLDEENMLKDDNNKLTSFVFDCDSMLNDTWEIFEEPVLDKQEKKYLKNFLKPYTKRYGKILVTKRQVENDYYYLMIEFYALKNDDYYIHSIDLPIFDKGEHMYDGMESNKFYTLEELGL